MSDLSARVASGNDVGSVEAGARMAARRLIVSGRVQGVGFRPFLFRLARRCGLSGFVRNHGSGVLVHVEGAETVLAHFMDALERTAPGLAQPVIEEDFACAPIGCRDFRVLSSEPAKTPAAHVPPDFTLCADCRVEFSTPGNRRYRYPFITCTQCGPRYTIIHALPYDRARTSMAPFALCEACRSEYEDPDDRRFHAEPLGCAACGPSLRFVAAKPRRSDRSGNAPALEAAISALRRGDIVAVKGVGGYHLMCDAACDDAVAKLRERKRRPTKPFAVLFPDTGEDALACVRASVELDHGNAAALTDPARPIVLAQRRHDCPLSVGLAPGLDTLGILFPYSPLHALIAGDFGAPVVATSGNVSGAPVITDPVEAERALAGVADGFLHHDRTILRPADDPVVRVSAGRPRVIRLGRGNAPAELELPVPLVEPVLAVGGHLKTTLGIGFGNRAVVSSHIGDLEDARSLDLFVRLADELPTLYGVDAKRIACDAHPDYASVRWARRQGLPLHVVQHHAAHASALAGEYPAVKSWLVFAWDGTGYGDDGTIWGGEALLGRPGEWRRVASFRPFRLPGGDLAARAPWRSAAAMMWEAGREYAPPLPKRDSRLLRAAWERHLNTPMSSAVGRIFDASGALVAGREIASHEAEAAMQLEALAGRARLAEAPAIHLPLNRDPNGVLRSDWSPILAMLGDETVPAPRRALCFHATLAHTIVAQARAMAITAAAEQQSPTFDAVGLTGGVFQNKLLAELAVGYLKKAGMTACLPTRVPANDGGLAFGQLVEAAAISAREAAT
jgi:hydrogenase maturation protein HypF